MKCYNYSVAYEPFELFGVRNSGKNTGVAYASVLYAEIGALY